MNIVPLSAKVANNRLDRMHSKNWSATAISNFRWHICSRSLVMCNVMQLWVIKQLSK